MPSPDRSNFEAMYHHVVGNDMPLEAVDSNLAAQWGYAISSTIDQHGHPFITLQPKHREKSTPTSLQFKSFVLSAQDARKLYHLVSADDRDRIKYELAREAYIEQMSVEQLEAEAATFQNRHEKTRRGFTISIIGEESGMNIKIGSITIEVIEQGGELVWHISSTELTAAKTLQDPAALFKKVLTSIKKTARQHNISAITCLINTQKALHQQNIVKVLEKQWLARQEDELLLHLSSMTPGRHEGEATRCQVIWRPE